MPEEVNRLLTDQIADLLLTHSRDADVNLLREGIEPSKIRFVGNVMIDTLVTMLPRARQKSTLQELGLTAGHYILVTLHRPSNVDHPQVLKEVLLALEEIARRNPVVFPVHPRTSRNIQDWGLLAPGVHFLDPLGYLEFLNLTASAGLVLTDSGGIQEETTYLGVPCLTLRPNTERPVTITIGTNRLVASQRQTILQAVDETTLGERGKGRIPEYWDGHASERIIQSLIELDK
jgi:UDP-N-acetylglucosamine 2-epimerase (non-hydrolysing)